MKGDDFSSSTEYLVLMQACLIRIGIIAGIIFFIFAKFNVSYFILAGYFIAASSLIISVVWLCKLLVDFIHRKLKVEELTKYRNDYLIAFGIFGIFNVVSRVLSYFPESSKEAFPIIALVYLISTTVIYCLFVLPTFDKKCTWVPMDKKTEQNFYCSLVLISLFLLIVSIRIAVECYDGDTRMGIIALQLACTFHFGFTFVDFANVWWGGVQLINANGGRNVAAVQSVESRRAITTVSAKPEPKPINKTVAPKPNCNICSISYTDNGDHTPRLIKECGHTICEQCAGKLVNAKLQNFLICPFCQKPTIVNGPAGTLPKNYALLEFTREVAQRG